MQFSHMGSYAPESNLQWCSFIYRDTYLMYHLICCLQRQTAGKLDVCSVQTSLISSIKNRLVLLAGVHGKAKNKFIKVLTKTKKIQGRQNINGSTGLVETNNFIFYA